MCVGKGVDERWASGGVKKWCLCACAHVCVGCDVVSCCIEQGNPVTPVRSGPADEHHPSSAHSSASQRRWSVAAEPEDALVVGTVGLFRVSLCSSIKVRPAHSVPVSRVLAICFFFVCWLPYPRASSGCTCLTCPLFPLCLCGWCAICVRSVSWRR